MLLYGLTGGVGMGKSAMASYLVALGWQVVDTDQIARDLAQPGERALEEIQSAFGPEMLHVDGSLDRGRLAQRVFQSKSDRARLEEILHPKIRRRWLGQVEQWRAGGVERAAVVIPLLYETGAEQSVDRVICVGCGRATQERRLLARGWSKAEIAGRIGAQWRVELKMDRADYVVWTESDIENSHEQMRRILSVRRS